MFMCLYVLYRSHWLEQASQWYEMYCHDLEVVSSNPSTSLLSLTWTKNIYVYINYLLGVRLFVHFSIDGAHRLERNLHEAGCMQITLPCHTISPQLIHKSLSNVAIVRHTNKEANATNTIISLVEIEINNTICSIPCFITESLVVHVDIKDNICYI